MPGAMRGVAQRHAQASFCDGGDQPVVGDSFPPRRPVGGRGFKAGGRIFQFPRSPFDHLAAGGVITIADVKKARLGIGQRERGLDRRQNIVTVDKVCVLVCIPRDGGAGRFAVEPGEFAPGTKDAGQAQKDQGMLVRLGTFPHGGFSQVRSPTAGVLRDHGAAFVEPGVLVGERGCGGKGHDPGPGGKGGADSRWCVYVEGVTDLLA